VSIFILVALLTNSCFIGVLSQDNKINTLPDSSFPSGIIPKFYFRVLVHGNASNGRQFGPLGNFGIIKFNHAQFVIIRFFPIKLIVNNLKNVTAFIYGINQELPKGSFDFDEEWILFAFVFERI